MGRGRGGIGGDVGGLGGGGMSGDPNFQSRNFQQQPYAQRGMLPNQHKQQQRFKQQQYINGSTNKTSRCNNNDNGLGAISRRVNVNKIWNMISFITPTDYEDHLAFHY
ncbi:hypothetical protein BVRB_2g034030 [Beta vulgaris subsp. vulgaris]|nr:hypothetical protein BVRB_2g034030 [Beta vulgaris subsp. vulgaris]